MSWSIKPLLMAKEGLVGRRGSLTYIFQISLGVSMQVLKGFFHILSIF
jgi:hypothetical protein